MIRILLFMVGKPVRELLQTPDRGQRYQGKMISGDVPACKPLASLIKNTAPVIAGAVSVKNF
jgi:hypothetical protein